jgi:hypothetical protein
LSSLYANKVQKRSRSLQKTAERERGGEQQLLRIKTSVITHVLLVHNDAGDDDDEKKYRRWVRGKNMEWRSEMNAGRAQLIDNQYHTLRAWAEKRESSSAKTPCVTPVRGADAFFIIIASIQLARCAATRRLSTRLLRAGVYSNNEHFI